MLAALVGVLLTQARLARFSVVMAVGVLASAVLLLLSTLNHMFPERSVPLSLAHLASVSGLLWLAIRSYRRQHIL